MKASDTTPWLHIRSQLTYHWEAGIVGTGDGLAALRDAIIVALSTGTGTAAVFATDGEGYEVKVQRSSTVRGLGKPTYLDEEARDLLSHERKQLIRTHRVIFDQDHEAMQALRWCRANGNPHTPTPAREDRGA